MWGTRAGTKQDSTQAADTDILTTQKAENTWANTQEADQGQVKLIRTITRMGNQDKTGSQTT